MILYIFSLLFCLTFCKGLLLNKVDAGALAHIEEQMKLMNATIQNNKQEIQGYKQEIQSYKQDIQSNKQEIQSYRQEIQNNKNVIQSLTSTVNKLQNETMAVAFLAELGKDLYNPSVGSGVIFDVVHLNEGNGYDNVHGIFRAPVDGIYHFTLELTKSPSSGGTHDIHFHLMKTTTELGYIFFTNGDNIWKKRLATATVNLRKSEDVWAKATSSIGNNVLTGGYLHSIFSGFLIRAIH